MKMKIERQVKLPLRVALNVVMQGIRIRLGRSLVTISGVALGVAFLMSIVAGQAIKQGVSDEQAIRNEIGRMYGFLVAEAGPVSGKTVAVLQAGPMAPVERRLLKRLTDEGVEGVRWTAAPGVLPDAAADSADQVDLDTLADGALVVLVMGAPGPGAMVDGPSHEAIERLVVCVTRDETAPAVEAWSLDGRPPVSLVRQMRPEERAKAIAEAQREAFRRGWIITISLLVTVIGISNAMLMSVTERFREIGTMKCLGALSAFIRQMFLIESMLMGMVGSVVGATVGVVFPMVVYGITFGFAMVLNSAGWLNIAAGLLMSFAVGVTLSVVAALYPAHFASKMLPAAALRSNI